MGKGCASGKKRGVNTHTTRDGNLSRLQVMSLQTTALLSSNLKSQSFLLCILSIIKKTSRILSNTKILWGFLKRASLSHSSVSTRANTSRRKANFKHSVWGERQEADGLYDLRTVDSHCVCCHMRRKKREREKERERESVCVYERD